ncbi:sulfite reductase flavoprotein subunit alpha [Undibacterium terreum]|uniref:Oxidoreductase n=1 Tax=Undibacterium terreum TaxID=1224302 RepID=A0A916XRR8_9BURK|nr:sulfite reductase flavoprotein subunit alpha [Undibacterium terreum]GGC97592.1 oxidoreductase [Undibacterium terreum]
MFKKIWFQIHWFIGITAGTIMIIIGLTGALLSFHEEIVDALNPGIVHVKPQTMAVLTPEQLLSKVRALDPERRIVTLAMSAEAGESAKITYAPPKGVRRGEIRYVDPYTGVLLERPLGQDFFEWIERLHRWLLLPTDTGKLVAGMVAACLFVLALSGLYLRWPRKPLSLRAWLKLDFALTGRSFLWNLHSVMGTCALLLYLIFTVTGMYWAFDVVKLGINTLAGETLAPRRAPPVQADKFKVGKKAEEQIAVPDLTLLWNVFQKEGGAYSKLSMRMPDKAGQPIQITYLDPEPPHEQARNRMSIDPATGKVTQNQRYADKTTGGKAISAIYPLHMGTYFGLPGRIIMTLAALILPMFSITGWMLYLDRRRKKRQIRAEQAILRAGRRTQAGAVGSAAKQLPEQVLLAFATQSGRAEGLAWRTASALQTEGVDTTVMSLAQLDTDKLRHYQRVLFIVSTFGEGEPPDAARKFARQLSHQAGNSLAHVQYGLLALGDRNYQKFCGFGHTLDHWLHSQGAQALFPMIEVDNNDAEALARWQNVLARLAGKTEIRMDANPAPALQEQDYQDWQLVERRLLNPHSQGAPIFHLELEVTANGAANAPSMERSTQQWQAGALAEIVPRHAPDRIAFFLSCTGLDGQAKVKHLGVVRTLSEALARSQLPAPQVALGYVTPQQLADTLQPLASRRYSVASLAGEGRLHLLVRQSRHEDGLGIASGWLTEYAAVNDRIELRVLRNPGFELIDGDGPSIFIGNGSGLAGLRGLLKARIAQGQHKNWLLYGERQVAHDFHHREEIQQWQADGMLSHVDLAFSRDQPQRIYVQDKLREQAERLLAWGEQGAAIYICGSLDGMAAGVDAVLTELLGEAALDDLITEGRYRRDVY